MIYTYFKIKYGIPFSLLNIAQPGFLRYLRDGFMEELTLQFYKPQRPRGNTAQPY